MTKIEIQKETNRYLRNGLDMLKKARKQGKHYSDKKYVKIAGHTLYSAVLISLDEIMPNSKKGRNTESDYRKFLSKRNKSVLKEFNSAYDILHRFMGYDGVLDVVVIKRGIESAKAVINWVLRMKKD